jgi:hypothetical protein
MSAPNAFQALAARDAWIWAPAGTSERTTAHARWAELWAALPEAEAEFVRYMINAERRAGSAGVR